MTIEPSITSRPYSGVSDLLLMQRFLATCTAARSPYRYWPIGELLWSMHYSPDLDPCQNAQLWEDAKGQIVGFAWFDNGEIVLQVHPRFRGSGLLEEPMLAWAAQRAGQSTTSQAIELTTFVAEDDRAYRALLQRHRFQRGAWSMVEMHCDLHAPLPDLPLPDGVSVRAVAGEDEYEERVALHGAAFHPSQFTLEAYRRLRSPPGYDPGLALVAVTADGTITAYCMCWLDTVKKLGSFEPVGTHPGFQRQGFGKAVMLEGLRRLKARGAEAAILVTGAAYDAGIKLYQSVGFRVCSTEHQYTNQG